MEQNVVKLWEILAVMIPVVLAAMAGTAKLISWFLRKEFNELREGQKKNLDLVEGLEEGVHRIDKRSETMGVQVSNLSTALNKLEKKYDASISKIYTKIEENKTEMTDRIEKVRTLVYERTNGIRSKDG